MFTLRAQHTIATCLIWTLAACGSNAEVSGPTAASAATGSSAVLPPTAANGAAGQAAPASASASAAVMPPTAAMKAPPTTTGAAPATAAAPSGAANAEAGKLWCGVKQTLDAHCTACHNTQKTAGAPMSLQTHADLIAPAVSDPTKKVYELVGTRTHDKQRPMPPPGLLDATELTPLDSWIAAGAPAGSDAMCAASAGPEAPQSTHPWPENCDATYKVYASNGDAPNTVGAGEETHPQFMVTPPWGNEEAQAIAWRSLTDNAKVLHHWILYGPTGEFLFGWAPGKDNNEPLPADTGMYLPSGTMRMDVHYNNVAGTTSEKDKSGVEICVLKRAHFRPKMASVTNRLSSRLINVPAHATNYDVTGTCTHMGAPANLLSVSPHAHRTAHHMKFTVQKANGQTIVMHDKDFNFAEQTTYALNPPIVVESGDKVITTCTFDNDTNQAITFGENTGNEMCFNFAIVEPQDGISCSGFGF